MNELLSKIEFTIHDWLRYFYTGMLTVLVLSLMYPNAIKEARDVFGNLGNFLAAMAILVIGAFIYVLQRWATGWMINWIYEIILRLFVHARWIARLCFNGLLQSCEKCKKWASTDGREVCSFHCESKRKWLESNYNLSFFDSLAVFQAIRDSLFDEMKQKRFHKQHSEISMLFATSFVCITTAVIHLSTTAEPKDYSKPILWFGIITFVVGIFADACVSIQECLHLKELNPQHVSALVTRLTRNTDLHDTPTKPEPDGSQSKTDE